MPTVDESMILSSKCPALYGFHSVTGPGSWSDRGAKQQSSIRKSVL